MITGKVNSRLQAVIPIYIDTITGQVQTFAAIVDTGFSDALMLPLSDIRTLGLPLIETRPFSLGNDAKVDFDLYGAIIQWDGQERHVLVLASLSPTLVGMTLLKGYTLFIDAIDGGEVRIMLRSPQP